MRVLLKIYKTLKAKLKSSNRIESTMIKVVNENALRGPIKNGLMFLFNLAWESRIRLPFLIAVGFMVLDIRMQLEINVDMAVRRMPLFQEDGNNLVEESDSEDDDSWETEEEEEYGDDSDLESDILPELQDTVN